MSQTTADNLLDTLGMAAVGVDHPKPTARAAKTSFINRGQIVALLSLTVLGVGFKFIGDYAAERGIEAWADRQRAPMMVATPEAKALIAQWENEQAQEALAESTAQTTATP